jgi:hypothetical protein
MTYIEKLRDPRWQKKRLKIFKRDQFICQSCYDSESTLVVHHLIYDKNKDPWDYKDEYLITLCEDCHNQEFEDGYDPGNGVIKALKKHGFLSSELIDIGGAIFSMENFHQREMMASVICFFFKNEDMIQMVMEHYFDYLKNRNAIR